MTVVNVVGVVVVVTCWKLAVHVVVLPDQPDVVWQLVLPVWVTTGEATVDPNVCPTVKTCAEGFEAPPAPFAVERVTLVEIPEPLPST